MRRALLDLLPQPPHVHGDGAGVERGLVAPDPAHQLVAGEDLARMAGEEPEQVELLRRQPQLLAVAAHLARARVELEPGEREPRP